MELIILGSGTGVPSLRRGAPAALLKIEYKNLLIDIGSGTLQKTLRFGISYLDLDALILTHLHPDHTSDLVPFFFACKYSLAPRTKELYLIGGKGMREFYERLKEVYGHWVKADSFKLHIQEAPRGKRDLLGICFATFPLQHTRSSIGLRFEHEGKVLAYSGDTDYCQELIEMGRGADLLVLECSFPNERKIQGHLTPKLAGKVAKEAEAKKLVLTHFYPPCDEADIISQCREEFSGEIVLAEDLMVLTL
jgi:ribonuclease BN (tRNA processing enzyme)